MSDYKQTRDAAGKVTVQYDKMLRNLDDDCIEEWEALYAAAKHDAQEAEAYAEQLEAKLGRAEWLLCDAMVQLRDGKIRTRRNRAGLIEAFLEELKGQNQ